MHEPDTLGLLQTFAEIAAAFAGFSALVSVVRNRGEDEPARVYAIGSVVSIALTSIAASMGAAVLLTTLEPATAWRIASAVFGVGWGIGATVGVLGFRRASGQSLLAGVPLFFYASVSLSSFGIALLVWNLISPEPPGAAFRYLVALLAQLAIAGLAFMLSVFWRPSAPE